jgi:hypothetical protein
VAMAVSSGATGLEAAAVVGEPVSIDAVRDLGGADLPVVVADASGTPERTMRT